MQKVQFGQSERSGVVRKSNVVIGQLKREREFLDQQGNVIDPRTKQIIKKNDASI